MGHHQRSWADWFRWPVAVAWIAGVALGWTVLFTLAGITPFILVALALNGGNTGGMGGPIAVIVLPGLVCLYFAWRIIKRATPEYDDNPGKPPARSAWDTPRRNHPDR
jgi:hypothetical protein